ncbi:hypothetical protein K2173_007439 [Erythroxylum novogranatense]|uniref:Protein TIC 20 n=1 Tax=Erythroxylum novogranatense TaxID=1862640 RepID=A0AAV8T675_9ROSI|nr:hypothetical protein K2173_007439 [Erythroxylum novogranatense]
MKIGYALTSAGGCKDRPCCVVSSSTPCFPAKAALSSVRNSRKRPVETKSWLFTVSSFLNSSFLTPGVSSSCLNAASSLSHAILSLPRHRRSYLCPRATEDVPSSFRYPPMTRMPRCWWRTLACLPYLMPLHETWMYAETFLTYPFRRALGRLLSWFSMAYFFIAYLGVMRWMKERPHFFRFHVGMGMLLEISLQVIGTVSRWMPLAACWGKLGTHFWTAVTFVYPLIIALECIR